MPAAVTDPPRRVLIIGAGLAGLRTAAELRWQGFTGELSIVGAEDFHPYDRPPLSKELLTRSEPAWLSDLGRLSELADRVLLEHPAVGLRTAEGVEVDVVGPDGQHTLNADAAVLAMGAHAWHPPSWQGARVLHTFPDASGLQAALHDASHLLVIGAGWIGAEVASVVAASNRRVTVLEAGPTPLWQALGPEVGSWLGAHYDAAGIELHTSVLVQQVAPGRVVASGQEGAKELVWHPDVVLAATGVRPATTWLSEAVPLTERGAVPVDLFGRIIDGPPQLRAVGDCADRHSPRDGIVPGAHWDGALNHPAQLVGDLLGTEDMTALDPAPYVFSTQLGHELAMFGTVRPGSRVVLRGQPDDTAWTALYVVEDSAGRQRLSAGLTLDRPRDVGALRKSLGAPQLPLIDLEAARDTSRQLRRTLAAP